MMKKRFSVIFISLILTLVMLSLTGCGITYRKNLIKEPRNVFEEIRNMFVNEEHGKETPLTLSTESAYNDYDLGEFVALHIPDCNMCISWNRIANADPELKICFFNDDATFIYDHDTKTLYGEKDLSYIEGKFLSKYFEWTSADSGYFVSEFSKDALGDFTFQYEETVHYIDHSPDQ